MSTEENKALVRNFYEEWNHKNIEGMMALISDDGVDHAMPPGLPNGPEGLRQFFSMYMEAFPDTHLQVEDMIAEDDKVVSRITMTGTNDGSFMGLPASG